MTADGPRIALVTGCRSGFGRATALALGRAGLKVYAGVRDISTSGALIAAARDLPISVIPLDVTSDPDRRRAIETIIGAHGRLDILVNNAGLALDGPLETIDEDDLRHLFEVNVFGVRSLTALALPHMRAQRAGRIILISSVSGRLAMPIMGAYASSKFALEAMGEAWRHELSGFGIDVTLIEPGPYRTEIFTDELKVDDVPEDYRPMVGSFLFLRRRIKHRAGDPEDVARLVVRLSSIRKPRLRYVVGPNAKLRTMLKSVLPHGLIERVVRRFMKPGRSSRT
jgi:NAD(P)-dependent dehydrogenase (short-subunit alcohol dehydrogenase family)